MGISWDLWRRYGGFSQQKMEEFHGNPMEYNGIIRDIQRRNGKLTAQYLSYHVYRI